MRGVALRRLPWLLLKLRRRRIALWRLRSGLTRLLLVLLLEGLRALLVALVHLRRVALLLLRWRLGRGIGLGCAKLLLLLARKAALVLLRDAADLCREVVSSHDACRRWSARWRHSSGERGRGHRAHWRGVWRVAAHRLERRWHAARGRGVWVAGIAGRRRHGIARTRWRVADGRGRVGTVRRRRVGTRRRVVAHGRGRIGRIVRRCVAVLDRRAAVRHIGHIARRWRIAMRR